MRKLTTPPPDAVIPARPPDAPEPGTDLGPHYLRCFACGDHSPGGLRMQFTAGEGLTVHSRFTVTEHHQGAPGLAHGGILACALDEVLGAVSALLREPFVTGRLETDYRRPVPVGTVLHLEARIDGRSGRKLYVTADGRISASDGPVAVRARAMYVAVGVEHFRAHGRPEDIAAASADPDLRGSRHFDVNP